MEREEYGETQRSEKHERNSFCDFCSYIYNNVKKKENPWLLTTNDSTNMLIS